MTDEEKAELERERIALFQLRDGDDHPEVKAWLESHPGEEGALEATRNRLVTSVQPTVSVAAVSVGEAPVNTQPVIERVERAKRVEREE